MMGNVDDTRMDDKGYAALDEFLNLLQSEEEDRDKHDDKDEFQDENKEKEAPSNLNHDTCYVHMT